MEEDSLEELSLEGDKWHLCLERMVELIHWSKYLYIVGSLPAEDEGLAWRIR
jgi:hypothetical protein